MEDSECGWVDVVHSGVDVAVCFVCACMRICACVLDHTQPQVFPCLEKKNLPTNADDKAPWCKIEGFFVFSSITRGLVTLLPFRMTV